MMSTPMTTTTAGFFVELMPLLADRTLMVIVSKADDQHLTLSVVPKRMKESENIALTTPLRCTGTPEELDRDLPAHLREFVAGHLTLSNNLAQIQRDREEAEKAAREDINKKRKTVGNSGAKNKTPEGRPPEEEPALPAPPPATMSLFDSPAEGEAPPVAESSAAAPDHNGSNKNDTSNLQAVHFRFGEVGPVLWRADHNLLSSSPTEVTRECGSQRDGGPG